MFVVEFDNKPTYIQPMCDIQCGAGIGITIGVVGILMTIVCCKTLCEFLLDLSKPDTVAPPVPTIRPPTQSPTVVEMPILIRIYLPQMRPGAAQQAQQPKAEFEPLPV
jgi:hypothetical protein